MQASFRARAFQPATLSRRTTVAVRAASAVAPVSVPVKAADGTEKGSQELAVKVASAATARGLVHRYLVMVQQNARRVRSSSAAVASGTDSMDAAMRRALDAVRHGLCGGPAAEGVHIILCPRAQSLSSHAAQLWTIL